jgi:hypothetical protein
MSSPFSIAVSPAGEAELRRRAENIRDRIFRFREPRMILHAAESMANDEIAALWTPVVKWSACGASVSLPTASLDWKNMLVRVVPGLFSPRSRRSG